MAEDQEPERMGIRDVLARVNLRDFGDMIKGEFGLVTSSLGLAVRSRSLAAVPAFVLALLRLVLLALVTVVLGTGIVLVTIVRAGARLLRSPATS